MSKFRKRYNLCFNISKKFQGIGIMLSSDGHPIADQDFYLFNFKFIWITFWVMIYKQSKKVFECYEIHVIQSRMFGCNKQCKECRQKELELK